MWEEGFRGDKATIHSVLDGTRRTGAALHESLYTTSRVGFVYIVSGLAEWTLNRNILYRLNKQIDL